MRTSAIRQKPQQWEYTDEFKKELDQRHAYYKNGGKMVSATEAGNQVKALVKKVRKNKIPA